MTKKTPIQFLFLGGEAFLFAGSGAVMYILISRLSGPDLLGQYSLALAWLLLFQSVANFGIPEFLMRESGRFHGEDSKYFSNCLYLGWISALTTMLVMAGVVQMFGYDAETRMALTLVAAALVPAIGNLICRSGFIAHKKAELIFTVALFETSVVLSINVYLLLNGYGIQPLIVTLIVGKSLSCLLSLLLFHHFIARCQWRLDFQFCKTLLGPVFIFAMSNVLGLISTRINIILLSVFGSVSMVGLYAAANKLVEIVMMIPSIFAQYMLPQMARTFRLNPNYPMQEYNKLIYVLYAASFVLGLGLINFADPVVALIFGKSFGESGLILKILVVFFLVECLDTLLATFLKAANRLKQDVRLFVVNPLVNILLSVVLIPLWGGVGAAVARLTGTVFSSILRYVYIFRRLSRYNWFRLMAQPALVSLILLAGSIALRDVMHFVIIGVIYVVASGLILYRIFIATYQKEPLKSSAADKV